MANLGLAINLLTFLAVVSGILFGMVQIQQQNRKRRDAAAVEAVRAFQTPEVRQAFKRVLGLRDGTPADEVRGDPQTHEDADVIIFTLETLGYLVYEGIMPLHTFDHLLGGFTRASLRKLRPYLDSERQSRSQHLGEWYQWLAERLEQYPAPGKDRPAYQSFAAWEP